MDLSSMELGIDPGSASTLAPTNLGVLLSVLKSKHIDGGDLDVESMWGIVSHSGQWRLDLRVPAFSELHNRVVKAWG